MIIYIHQRKDNNEIFYVGIGEKESRAYEKGVTRRNQFWRNVTNKADYEVKIVARDIDLETAKRLERYLVKHYGRKNIGAGSLVNLTDGGDGTKGYRLTQEHKDSIRKSKLGHNNPNFGKKLSEETCRKMGLSRSGGKHYKVVVDDNFRKRMSLASKGKLLGGKHHQAKKVINTETGEVFSTIKEVAELLGIKFTTMAAKLRGQNINNTSYKILT